MQRGLRSLGLIAVGRWLVTTDLNHGITMPPNPTTPDELIAYLGARAAQVRDLTTLVNECHDSGIGCPTLEALLENTLRDTERITTECLAALSS